MAENTVIEPLDAVSKMNGIPFKAIPWDGILSMANGRGWYACPMCGLSVSGPLGENVMVHQECYEALKHEN